MRVVPPTGGAGVPFGSTTDLAQVGTSKAVADGHVAQAQAQVRVAMGHTDRRKGVQGIALMVQQQLHRNPHGGDLFVFRGRIGSLVKIIWHDGLGMSPYAKRLEKAGSCGHRRKTGSYR